MISNRILTLTLVAACALSSCNDDVSSAGKSTKTGRLIEVDATSTPFSRAVAESGIDDLKRDGFIILAKDDVTSDNSVLYFEDTCSYNGRSWKFGDNHAWPIDDYTDEEIPLDFAAFYAPSSKIVKYDYAKNLGSFPTYQLNDVYICFDKQPDGGEDWMYAHVEDQVYGTNNGRISLDFKHMLTQVSVNAVIKSTLLNEYENYSVEFRIYTPSTHWFCLESHEWESLGDDFDNTELQITEFSNNDVPASTEGIVTPLKLGTIHGEKSNMIIPTRCAIEAVCIGYYTNDNGETEGVSVSRRGFADQQQGWGEYIDLTPYAGKRVEITYKIELTGDGYRPKDDIVTDDSGTLDEIDAPEIRVFDWED
ncbi:MAG: fimbrillin family protein [Bacteroidales bacterium]|nr:fimbrillin family protein [Candidatus Liminaster caballi]